MSLAVSNAFKRTILSDSRTSEVVDLLQSNLVHIIDLSLILKQAHWNVVGSHFKSVHEQLDEIEETTRNASDEVAERIVALGRPAQGTAEVVCHGSNLKAQPEYFVAVSETIEYVADAVHHVIAGLRKTVAKLAEVDPVSEDLCIGLLADLEKHLWMLQAQEVGEGA